MDYLIVFGALFLIIVSVLAEELVRSKYKVKHLQEVITNQIADMRRMVFELEEWETCVGFMIKEDAEKVLEMLEAKIKRAEAEKCFWEPRRLNLIKENYLKKLKNSAYEDKEVSGETAEE